MCPQGARTVSTSLVQQMAHTKALSMRFSLRSRSSASVVALANAAWAFRASSECRQSHRTATHVGKKSGQSRGATHSLERARLEKKGGVFY